MCSTYYLYVFIIRILIVIIIFFQFKWYLIILYMVDFFINFCILLPSMNKFIQMKKAEEVKEAKAQVINEHFRPLTNAKKQHSSLIRGSSGDLGHKSVLNS